MESAGNSGITFNQNQTIKIANQERTDTPDGDDYWSTGRIAAVACGIFFGTTSVVLLGVGLATGNPVVLIGALLSALAAIGCFGALFECAGSGDMSGHSASYHHTHYYETGTRPTHTTHYTILETHPPRYRVQDLGPPSTFNSRRDTRLDGYRERPGRGMTGPVRQGRAPAFNQPDHTIGSRANQFGGHTRQDPRRT